MIDKTWIRKKQQYTIDPVNINQHQEEEKGGETQPKKGFWSRLFGG